MLPGIRPITKNGMTFYAFYPPTRARKSMAYRNDPPAYGSATFAETAEKTRAAASTMSGWGSTGSSTLRV